MRMVLKGQCHFILSGVALGLNSGLQTGFTFLQSFKICVILECVTEGQCKSRMRYASTPVSVTPPQLVRGTDTSRYHSRGLNFLMRHELCVEKNAAMLADMGLHNFWKNS